MVPMLDTFLQAAYGIKNPVLCALTELFRRKQEVMLEELAKVSAFFASCEVPMFLLKGIDLALEVYPPGLTRMMNDIDILVRPGNVKKVEQILLDSGYVQARVDRTGLRLLPLTAQQIAFNEREHYELAPFLKLAAIRGEGHQANYIDLYLRDFLFLPLAEDVFIAPTFDVHLNVSADIDLRDIWHDPRTVALPSGGFALGQAPADMLCYTSARAYHEIMSADRPCLRLFIDIVMIVHHFSGRLDWDRVVWLACKYDMQPSLYYTMTHVNEILPDSVPNSVLLSTNVSLANVKRYHDWGDFVPKLLACTVVTPLVLPLFIVSSSICVAQKPWETIPVVNFTGRTIHVYRTVKSPVPWLRQIPNSPWPGPFVLAPREATNWWPGENHRISVSSPGVEGVLGESLDLRGIYQRDRNAKVWIGTVSVQRGGVAEDKSVFTLYVYSRGRTFPYREFVRT